MEFKKAGEIEVQLIRNATVVLTIGGKRFLVDPMFGEKNSYDPIPWTNETRYPMVDLPFSKEQLKQTVDKIDYVLLTHLHPDHWDIEAQKLVAKDKTLVCQPQDVKTLREQGFTSFLQEPVSDVADNIRIIRVAAQHGHGELAEKMAPASGYIIKWNERTVYITGDTVWYSGVKETLEKYSPDVIIVNTGAARFQFGEPITMTAEDVLNVLRNAKKDATVIAVHMETVNHCYLKRKDLREVVHAHSLQNQCIIPGDGENFIV